MFVRSDGQKNSCSDSLHSDMPQEYGIWLGGGEACSLECQHQGKPLCL